VDKGEAVGEEPANDLLSSVHHVPVVDNLSLLLTLIPDGRHDEERRLANSLKDTEECSDRDKSWIAEAECMAAKDGRPEKDVGTKEFSDGNTLNGPVDGVLDNQDGDVDTSSEPSPL
jgi:hypothetical protein